MIGNQNLSESHSFLQGSGVFEQQMLADQGCSRQAGFHFNLWKTSAHQSGIRVCVGKRVWPFIDDKPPLLMRKYDHDFHQPFRSKTRFT